jgi:hypothetical protein
MFDHRVIFPILHTAIFINHVPDILADGLCLSFPIAAFSLVLEFLSFFARANSFLLITTPSIDGGIFKEASFASPALSPKIARQ